MTTSIKRILILLTTTMVIWFSNTTYCMAQQNIQQQHEQLIASIKGERAQHILGSFYTIASTKGIDYSINNLILLYQSSDEDAVTEVVNGFVKVGLYSEYYDRFAEAGIPINQNTAPSSSTDSKKNIQTSPIAFTVEDITPYPAWATKNCNIRSGADTTYGKVGTLKKFEPVTVTGKASTGWFRIKTSDGKEAYISNALLTTEDPNKVTFQTEEGNGTVVTTTVEGDNAEAVAKVVEEIQAETPHENEAEVSQESDVEEVSSQGIEAEAPHEHLYGEWEITKKATLISTGEKIKKCTVCGEIMETEVIPAKTGLLIVLIISIVAVLCGGIAIAFAHKKKVLISKNA